MSFNDQEEMEEGALRYQEQVLAELEELIYTTSVAINLSAGETPIPRFKAELRRDLQKKIKRVEEANIARFSRSVTRMLTIARFVREKL